MTTSSEESLAEMGDPVTLAQLKICQQNLQSSLTDCFKSLLKNEFTQFKADINSVIEDKIKPVEDKVCSFESQLQNFEHRLNVLDANTSEAPKTADFYNLLRLNDVFIVGIPYIENEKVLDIVANLSKAINFTLSPYIQAFRLRTKNAVPEKQNNGAIVAKFSCIAEKNSFLAACRKNQTKLTLANLNAGFSSASKLRIFESLLPKEDAIRKKANELRRANRITAVAVFNGSINVKVKSSDKFIRITSIEHLVEVSLAAPSTPSHEIEIDTDLVNEDKRQSNK